MNTTKFFKTALFTGAMMLLMSFDFPMPFGWFAAGSDPKSYDMGTDAGAGQDGKNAATIKSIDKEIKGFGTLMQNCLPGKYLGKRVKMTGYMKTADVQAWAGFWLRVDQKGSQQFLSFDNMYNGKSNRSITGTTSWTKYEIVLDVPAEASNIAYGALLNGTGQIWFDNLSFEIVDNSVPTTGSGPNDATKSTLAEPTNLNFQK